MPLRSHHEDVEVDIASFVVRSQKFRIAAFVRKRTSIPLATEYATRLVHLVPGIRLDDLVGFFDFEPAEARILLQDLLGTGLVVERNGQLFLSQHGHEALSPMTDKLDLFEIEEITTTITLDLAAFAPVEESSLNPRETRLVEELKLPDREKAASAIAAAREGFDLHFQEWRLSHGRRRWLDEDTRLHSIEDVQAVGSVPSIFQVPIRWRSGDMPGVAPDFSELSSKGRAGSRIPLISTISARLKTIVAPADHQAAFEVVDALDDGMFRRDGVRSTVQQAEWARLATHPEHRVLTRAGAPGMRLVGSTSAESVRTALLDWTQGVGGASVATRTPVFWLPPQLPTWGRSVPFVNLARDLSTAHQMDDGTVLLARAGGRTDDEKLWQKLYGSAGKLPPLFDRCLAVPASDLPDALEIVLKPGSWALVLIHSPDANTSYPFPFGYITAAPQIVERFVLRIAELSSKADGTRAVLWTRAGEDAHGALARIDGALGIGVA